MTDFSLSVSVILAFYHGLWPTEMQLLNLRLGPGAAVLPRDVLRIHLSFATRINGGHFGPRRFWREHLPRLKFHNPGVSMKVDRTSDQASPATMTIFFSHSPAARTKDLGSDASSVLPTSERVEVIDMKNKKDTEILGEFLKITSAVEVLATAAEIRQLEELEEHRERSQTDRQHSKQLLAARLQDQRLLDQARRAVA